MKNTLPSFESKLTKSIFALSIVNLLFIFLMLSIVRPALIDSLATVYLSRLSEYIQDDIQYVLLVRDQNETVSYIESVKKLPWIEGIEIYYPDGTLIYSVGNSNWQPLIDDFYSGVSITVMSNESHLTDVIETNNDEGISEPAGLLHISIDGSSLIHQVNNAFYLLVLSLAFGSIILWVVTRLFARHAAKSVATLDEELNSVVPDSQDPSSINLKADSLEMQNVEFSVNALLKRLSAHHLELETRVEQRTLELEKALEANSLAEAVRTSLIMNISHDLKTPLTSNLGYIDHAIELIEDDSGGSDDILEMLRRARHYCMVLTVEIRTLLQYSESIDDIDDISHDYVDIEKLVNECIGGSTLLSKASNNKVYYEHTGETAYFTSRRLLKFILDNLITNAHKYCADGEISIVTSTSSNKSFALVVVDNGMGIPDNEREYIFERHFQAANNSRIGPRGMGIGLSLTKFWVDKLGGTITVNSVEGEYTKFTLHIAGVSS